MFRELLAHESRMPPLLGTGLAAVLMGAVAFASAQASLPSRSERMSQPLVPAVAPPPAAARAHIAQPQFVFAEPLAGFAVNSPFGMRKMPWEEGGRLHQGVDIAAPKGTPVRATLAGTVLRSGVDGGYGRFVEIAHAGGLTSLYGHLGRDAGLKSGAAVPAGTVVGYVGSTGRSTGAHLHFEIREDGRPLNPTAFMGQAFMTQADLPLTAAGRISRRVRVAQVASWPAGLRRQAEAAVSAVRADSENATASSVLMARKGADGRVRAVIRPPAEYAKPAPQMIKTPPTLSVPAPTPSASSEGEHAIVTAAG